MVVRVTRKEVVGLSDGLSEREVGEVFYRYMSDEERRVVEDTGMLRGGRGAGLEETHWTDEVYGSSAEARARLSLADPPEVRLAFRMAGRPVLLKDGATVAPDGDQPGGGTEWMTTEVVQVEVIGYAHLDD